jgi:hypothetical protein
MKGTFLWEFLAWDRRRNLQPSHHQGCKDVDGHKTRQAVVRAADRQVGLRRSLFQLKLLDSQAITVI